MVFIDHMMPDMDGIETLQRLGRETNPVPVCIALTANAVSGAREMYLNAGFSDYLSKPVDGRLLEEMLKQYLPAEKMILTKVPSHMSSNEVDVFVKTQKEANAPMHTSAETFLTPKNLVVDDDEVICAAIKEILGESFSVESCLSANETLNIAKKMSPSLILLDINMAGMSGFEVFQKLREDADTCTIPVMYITADEDREKEALALKNGAQDLIRKPFVPEVLLQRCKRIIALDRYQKNLQGEVIKQTDRAERLNREMMLALSHTVDAKDHYTNGHSERVASYAAEIARRMGKSVEDQEKLYKLGLLHDIGKIGISEDIINKTEKLTKDEFGEIKEHTVIGYEILKGITDMPELCIDARSHHEKYDGSGYPDGKGEISCRNGCKRGTSDLVSCPK
ncbi:MAG: response regulator [Lachnospiraceae bacterium]|nr:response regulator [Lachnospiraceae bacterium]